MPSFVNSYSYSYITPDGFGIPYSDYFRLAIDNAGRRGTTQAAWDESSSYAGRGNIWTAPTRSN